MKFKIKAIRQMLLTYEVEARNARCAEEKFIMGLGRRLVGDASLGLIVVCVEEIQVCSIANAAYDFYDGGC